MNGGNGIDGQTVLSWLDPVEMGGTLLLEAVGVTLSPGSTGILAGFFTGGKISRLHSGFSGNGPARNRGGNVCSLSFRERPRARRLP